LNICTDIQVNIAWNICTVIQVNITWNICTVIQIYIARTICTVIQVYITWNICTVIQVNIAWTICTDRLILPGISAQTYMFIFDQICPYWKTVPAFVKLLFYYQELKKEQAA
jgi:hypothetical protein